MMTENPSSQGIGSWRKSARELLQIAVYPLAIVSAIAFVSSLYKFHTHSHIAVASACVLILCSIGIFIFRPHFSKQKALLIAFGDFKAKSYHTSGTVKFYTQGDTQALIFESFFTECDLYVEVLMINKSPSANLNLGSLKAVNGNFEYIFPEAINPEDVNEVVLKCKNEKIAGRATLKKIEIQVSSHSNE
jgi:hypothetical protein